MSNKECCKRYYRTHRDELLRKKRERYAKNRETYREYQRQYRQAHLEQYREYRRKYREKKKQEEAGLLEPEPETQPEGCIYPDCFHCPLPDCMAGGTN